MHSPIKIRPAVINDAAVILSMIQELAAFEKLSHEVTATETQLKETLFGEEKKAHALIGEINGQAVAFALYFYSYSTFLAKPGIYLEDLYVKPEYRSQGFGAHFFSELFRIAREGNCGRVEWSVLDWNKKAIAFYERLGAQPRDGWMVYRILP